MFILTSLQAWKGGQIDDRFKLLVSANLSSTRVTPKQIIFGISV